MNKPLAFALGLLLTSACVPAGRYRELHDAYKQETTAHRSTRERADALARQADQLGARLTDAKTGLDQRASELDKLERLLEQARLDLEVTNQERQRAVDLVEQLREELARVGDHLRAYSDEKVSLAKSLSEAEKKAAELAHLQQHAAERALVLRDLALVLHGPVSAGEVELALGERGAVLRVPATQLFSGTELRASAKAYLLAVARVARLHGSSRVEVIERDPAASPLQRAERLKRVLDGLAKEGLSGNRVRTEEADGTPTTDPEPHLEFRFASATAS
jgi:hypothetical protein